MMLSSEASRKRIRTVTPWLRSSSMTAPASAMKASSRTSMQAAMRLSFPPEAPARSTTFGSRTTGRLSMQK
jgi:hypothetical protein